MKASRVWNRIARDYLDAQRAERPLTLALFQDYRDMVAGKVRAFRTYWRKVEGI